MKGKNQPDFQALQMDFAAHIRHPDLNPLPDGIEPRRMAIYVRLIYNNIETFCSTRFNRTKTILGEKAWHALVRDFVHRHQSASPYFSQISEEFISFLAVERDEAEDPKFLLELCHFEWLSLYLDRLNETLPQYKPCEDPLEGVLVLSPLAIVRKYVWPVNTLSADNIPASIPRQPTWILAHRDRADNVHIRVTSEAIALLAERFRMPTVVKRVAKELVGRGRRKQRNNADVLRQRLHDLIDLDILLVK